MIMKRVCAWCRKDIGAKSVQSAEDDTPITTHGICADCTKKVLLSRAKTLRSYLDRFSGPVFLVDSDGRIVTANKEGFSVLGKRPEEVEGQLGGDAFECRYAGLPGGCGKTIHCKTCTIRRTVTDTQQSGRSHIKVIAYPDLHHITGDKRIRFLISTEKIGNAVFLRIDEISEESREHQAPPTDGG